ncbi:AraC family transcriptional regulator [Pseudomonas sp. NA13]
MRSLFDVAPDNAQLGFAATLTDDARLASATAMAFQSLHEQEIRIVRQTALDTLLANLTQHLHWRARINPDPRLPLVAQQARDYLHSHLSEDIGLDDLAQVTGVDRFRLTRAFKAAFGLAPHAYLIQLRLARARRLLACGERRGSGGHARFCRPKPLGSLVPARLSPEPGGLPQALLNCSRLTTASWG